MSKKLATEIEKCLRESQANMQTYDLKWRELKSYNEATANPDWAVLGSGVIKCNSPEVVVLSGLKAKKAQSGPSVITVDISNMSEKQVAEVKEKLKNELEALMKKVYRSRQQLMEWIVHADLRQTGFTKEHLIDARKEIELRHRKGKVYYLRNVSSEDTSNEQASQFNEVIQWMQLYIDKLRDKSDQFTAEIETLSRKQDQQFVPERVALLHSAVEMYLMHANRLDELLRGIRNNTISVHTGTEDGGDTSEEAQDAGGGEGVELLLKRLAELKEVLAPFIEENDDLMYIVEQDIYDDLGLVAGVGKLLDEEPLPTAPLENVTAPLVKSPGVSPHTGPLDPTNTVTSPPRPVSVTATVDSPVRHSPSPQPPSAATVHTSAWSSRQITAEAVLETDTARSSFPSSADAKPHNVSYRTILQPNKDGSSLPTPVDQPSSPTAIERRLQCLEGKLSIPGWSEGGRLILSPGVTSNLCDAELFQQLSPAAQSRLLQQVEALSSTPPSNSLPVLVLDAKVSVSVARRSWNGELSGGGPEMTRRILEESTLLFVEEGTRIEILAAVPRDRWTYGRLANDKSKQGWFPSHIVQ